MQRRQVAKKVVQWTGGHCTVPGCKFTMVTYVGGGQWWCWLHAVLEGLVDLC